MAVKNPKKYIDAMENMVKIKQNEVVLSTSKDSSGSSDSTQNPDTASTTTLKLVIVMILFMYMLTSNNLYPLDHPKCSD
jgi:hypothetical protein